MKGFDLLFIARTIDLAGKVLISYMAVRVHHRVWQEHRIDKKVFTAMETEQRLGFLGISLLILAYSIEAYLAFT